MQRGIVFGLVGPAIMVGSTLWATTAQVQHIEKSSGGGFTQVVTTTDRDVKTIFVSGQVGQGDNLEEHVESAFQGVVHRLEQAGASVDDVVKIRIFVKNFEPDQYAVVAGIRRETFTEGHWPASTMIGVRSLYRDSCGRTRNRFNDRAF